MNKEITVEFEGKEFTAEYSVIGEMLTVYLPDGTQRQTALFAGIDPHSAAATHVRSYASQNT